MTIYVLNPVNDIHCNYMTAYFKRNRIDVKELKSPLEHDYALLNNVLYYDGEPITEVRAVFFRGIIAHQSDPLKQADAAVRFTDQTQFAARMEVIQSWLHILSDHGVCVLQTPGFRAKYVQLQKLHQAGIPMPKTCVTSSPEIAKSFVQSVESAICKPIRGGSYCLDVDERVINQLDLILTEPVIFQEKIEGEDIRVNMLDGNVLSAHIIRTSSPNILDYRTDPAYRSGETEYVSIQLPESVIKQCRRAMDVLGLRFSGIDLRWDGDRFCLIECNSMPAYMDIELKTGKPITHHLAEVMLQAQPVHLLSKGQTIQSLTDVFRPKKSFKRGESLFDYYDVMLKWREQMNRFKTRQLIELNENQRLQISDEIGVQATFAEVEVNDGKAEVIRFL